MLKLPVFVLLLIASSVALACDPSNGFCKGDRVLVDQIYPAEIILLLTLDEFAVVRLEGARENSFFRIERLTRGQSNLGEVPRGQRITDSIGRVITLYTTEEQSEGLDTEEHARISDTGILKCADLFSGPNAPSDISPINSIEGGQYFVRPGITPASLIRYRYR